jgi:hypothetical protein
VIGGQLQASDLVDPARPVDVLNHAIAGQVAIRNIEEVSKRILAKLCIDLLRLLYFTGFYLCAWKDLLQTGATQDFTGRFDADHLTNSTLLDQGQF